MSSEEGGAGAKRKDPPEQTINLADCPVCMMPYVGKVFQCKAGHVVCEDCLGKIAGKCPSCRGPLLGDIRNRLAEDFTGAMQLACGHAGCDFVCMRSEIPLHRKTCAHRPYMCPYHRQTQNPCQWQGGSKDKLMEHLVSRHSAAKKKMEKEYITLRLRKTQRNPYANWMFIFSHPSMGDFIAVVHMYSDALLSVYLFATRDCAGSRWMCSVLGKKSSLTFSADDIQDIRDTSVADLEKSGDYFLTSAGVCNRMCTKCAGVESMRCWSQLSQLELRFKMSQVAILPDPE
jgi:hypothetical protein